MKILTDYHTHTIYSKNNHGKGTVRENVEAAIEKGLKEIWITEHGPSHIMFGIKRRNFPKLRKEVDQLKEEYKGIIDIHLGVEANVMTYKGKIDIKENELQYLDGINVGFHYGIVNPSIKSFFYFWIVNHLARIIKPLRPWIAEKNTDALINVVNKNKIQIITHPGDKVGVNIVRLAEACEKVGTALEINSSHANMNIDDIKKIMNTGVKVSVGSDAHDPSRVGNFEDAIARIEKTKLPLERIINKKEY